MMGRPFITFTFIIFILLFTYRAAAFSELLVCNANMSNPDTQLLTLLQPFGLNFREILQACLFHAARPPDLPYMEFCTAIAANLNERRGAATTPERVAAALDFMRDTADLDFVLPRDRPSPALQQFAPKLRAQGKGAAASPVIAACPAPGCGAALEQRVACSNAQFYDDAGGAQRGVLYCKECPDCKTQCFLNGYEVPPAAGGARARTPYPDAAHEHPYWEGFSRETVVAVKLLKRYTGELKWGFCSAGAGAKIFNYSNDLGERAAPPAATPPPSPAARSPHAR